MLKVLRDTHNFEGNSWFKDYTNPKLFKELLKLYKDKIQATSGDFDYIVCQGVSGAFLAAPLSVALNRYPLVIKKNGETSHRCSLNGHVYLGDSGTSYIIVDDLIDSGNTIAQIQRTMNSKFGNKTHCKGIYIHTSVGNYYKTCNNIQVHYVTKENSMIQGDRGIPLHRSWC